MSYRTVKRLLGETSLERKCRWLLGTGTLVLMAASFLVYARLTEDVAYDQLLNTSRTLVSPVISRLHVRQNPEMVAMMTDFNEQNESNWPANLQGYRSRLLRPDDTRPDRDAWAEDAATLRDFEANPTVRERYFTDKEKHRFVYYATVRASAACVECHQSETKLTEFLGPALEPRTGPPRAIPELAPDGLMAVVRVEMNTGPIEDGIHQNRAWLIALAVGSTGLILAGTYLIIRYVIVQPVKELKTTADAISNGELTVRSDIQTGDEFEDLSQAFNRMLTNLVQIQDRNRGLIGDLDGKVDELARINLELHQSAAMRTEFLATMSHELRTPLNSVIGFSEAFLNAENLTEKQHRWAANIHDSGKHLLALVNDVLDLARVESGKIRVKPTTLNVTNLCEQAAMQIRPQAEKKEIELLVQVPPDTLDVRQDEGKVRQVLSNLLSNAVKFTPEGGRITLRGTVENDTLLLSVSDTGVGIAPENQEVVFQKFRQTSNHLTREQGGTGLGLSIVRELSRLLGGDVRLQSELGRGSTFIVRLAAKLKDDPLAAFASE
jgi:two-component system, NarL family, sensor histidine kinase BarA